MATMVYDKNLSQYMYRFSISGYGVPEDLKAHNFTFVKSYYAGDGTVITTVQAPAGTVEMEQTTPASDVGYGFSERRRYRLPTGQTFIGGGGGPVDADIVRIEHI